MIREARRRSIRKGHLTLKLRDMGGLIRVAGDLATAGRGGDHYRRTCDCGESPPHGR